ncbi:MULTISPECIES: NAD-dependent epimerase/dehydratase family protein [Streptomyces]|uniref:NAD-dependent epimerase/dehydratase family protein n=1 Tax=Streptomyces TaxID=1883 RepID=UPI000A68984F|nr:MULTISPECIES: NAD(P)-dependent oxidoreductase [Streptomyces]
MSVAVTGCQGYLGSAVVEHLRHGGTACRSGLGRLQELRPGSVDSRAVIHCAGALRSRPAPEIWHANVVCLTPLLRAIDPDCVVVLASSRAAAAPPNEQDLYGRSKNAAEQIADQHPGPVRIVRLTVLAGPSPAGLGDSFVSRMTDAALRTGAIRIPADERTVDFLDVREAAAVMAGLTDPARPWPDAEPVDATSGPLELTAVARATAEAVQEATGRRVRVVRTGLPAGSRQPPADPTRWARLRTAAGVTPRAPLSTIRDTVRARVRAGELSTL